MIHVGPVEAVYVGTNILAMALTMYAIVEAWRDYRVVKSLNGKAREIAVRRDIRREWFRLGIIALLLFYAIPELFVDRDIPLTYRVVILMAIPLMLLGMTYSDFRERRRLLAIIARETSR